MGQDLEKTISAHKVECLGEVNKGNIKCLSLCFFCSCLSEKIMSMPFCSKSALRLWVDSLSQYLQFHQDNFVEEFANDVKERDAAVIVTVTLITHVRVKSDNVGISHIPRNLAFSPALVKYLM